MSYYCPKDGARVPSWMPRHFPCRGDVKFYIIILSVVVIISFAAHYLPDFIRPMITAFIETNPKSSPETTSISLTEGAVSTEDSAATNATDTPTQTPAIRETVRPSPTSNPTATEQSKINSSSPETVFIPAGEFQMGGSAIVGREECLELYPGGACDLVDFIDEEPIHVVNLNDFSIDKYEVSNSAYATCVKNGACQPPYKNNSYTKNSYFGNPDFADYPVIYVSWNDAQAYCTWRGGRLPTEAEWEKAARGTSAWLYPWGNQFDGERTNFCDGLCGFEWASSVFQDGFTDTSPVMSYSNGASPYGALNMAGNVWEWTADWYSDNYYNESPVENPTGPNSGSTRVIRGGAWNCVGSILRSSTRLSDFPEEHFYNVGFRCVTKP